MLGLKTRPEYIHIDPHDRTRIEHRADARLGVVAHEKSAKGTVGSFQLSGGVAVEFHGRKIIF